MKETIVVQLDSWSLLAAMAVANAASLLAVLRDMHHRNAEISGLMRWVWILTVTYSGPLGLAVYYYSGRKQIPRDSLWRRAFRSVAHCYSGCGAGEIVGLVITVGLLGLGVGAVAITTFCFAYAFGFILTAGPLIQDNVPVRRALWDAFVSDTASITVMEVSAIGLDLWLAFDARISEPLFWSSMLVSLSFGLLAAYPVNVLLIRLGIKEGMHDPRKAMSH
ncbi:MAG TPA: DUF4396 domain-containing protein [Gammaproteobacteria bacterium]|nr:DUF4396 domain-containing protein [Gammaproteobacteria bacterium]